MHTPTSPATPATRLLAALELRVRADVHRERRDWRRAVRAGEAADRLEIRALKQTRPIAA